MAVLREIHFGGGGVLIGKGAHALDHVETNLGNFLRSQPFQNYTPLKRDWQRTETGDRELGIGRIRELFFDPIFFFAGDCSSPPNGRTNISAKNFLQVRDDAMTNAVAKR
ncbi:MAG TPA: hypothetical protein VN801_04475, partial [Candidatus Udaeobacter sp.]|nr:hypothetical protein [Candidatus Udaeobacter sp.]